MQGIRSLLSSSRRDSEDHGGPASDGGAAAYEPIEQADPAENDSRMRSPSAQRVIHLHRSGLPSESRRFPDNTLRSTKYSPVTFLPIFLTEQFGTPMNLYFLMIACLQLWKAITPINPITTWAPLILVLTVSAVKEISEDKKRKEADRVANSKPFEVYRSGVRYQSMPSRDLRVGDCVVLKDGDEAPCDLFLLRVVKGSAKERRNGGDHRVGAAEGREQRDSDDDDNSNGDGDGGGGAEGEEDEDDNMALSAFVETSNLDGETDLKPRLPCPEIQCLAVSTVVGVGASGRNRRLDGRLVCEPPNAELYKFDAAFYGSLSSSAPSSSSSSSFKVSLSANSLIQHGTILRSTGRAYCLAVYTGSQTKLSQNKLQASGSNSGSGDSSAGSAGGLSSRLTSWFVEAVSLVAFLLISLFGGCCGRMASCSRCCLWLRRQQQRSGRAFGSRAKAALRRTGGGAATSSTGGKRSVVDRAINRLVIFIFLAQLVLVVVFGTLGTIHNGGGPSDGRWYLGWPAQSGSSSHLLSVGAVAPGAADGAVVPSEGGPDYHYHLGSASSPSSSGSSRLRKQGDSAQSQAQGQGGEAEGAEVDPDDYLASVQAQERLAKQQKILAEHEREHELRLKKEVEDKEKLLSLATKVGSAAASPLPGTTTVTTRRFFDGHKDEDLGTGAGRAPAAAPASRHLAVRGGLSEPVSNGAPASIGLEGAREKEEAPVGSSSSSSSSYSWFFFLINSAAVILPLRFLLLSSMLIPISLKVSLDLVKVLYGRWIQGDAEMTATVPGATTASSSKATNTSVVEDLGKVDIVLSDKTGTLTENRMVTAAISVRGQLYCVDNELLSSSSSSSSATNVAVDLDSAASAALAFIRRKRSLSSGNSGGNSRASMTMMTTTTVQQQQHEQLIDFFKALVLCSSVEPARDSVTKNSSSDKRKKAGKKGKEQPRSASSSEQEQEEANNNERVALMIGSTKSPSPVSLALASASPSPSTVADLPSYSSASPDESALVTTAASCGVKLVSRRHDKGGKQRIGIRLALPRNNDVSGHDQQEANYDDEEKEQEEEEEEEEFEVLHVLEFTSARKCMSVVLRKVDKGRRKAVAINNNNGPAAARSRGSSPVRGRRSTHSTTASAAAEDERPGQQQHHAHPHHHAPLPSPMYRAAHHQQQHSGSQPGSVLDGANSNSSSSSNYAGVDSDELILITKGADEVLAKMLNTLPPPSSSSSSPSLLSAVAPVPVPVPVLPVPASSHALSRRSSSVAEMSGSNNSSASAASPSDEGGVAASVIVDTTFNGHLKLLASKGLRTLVVAGRTISQEEYNAWLPLWEQAHHHHHNQQQQQQQPGQQKGAAPMSVAQACSLLERRLTLLGCTAIEDALQQGVPHAVSDLLKAGIKVWMLTGDKAETAVQIGKSCNLIPSPAVDYYRGAGGAASGGGTASGGNDGKLGLGEEAVAVTIRAARSIPDPTLLPAPPSAVDSESSSSSATRIFTIKASAELELSAQLQSLASALGEKNVPGIPSSSSSFSNGANSANANANANAALSSLPPRFSIVVDGIATLNLLLNHYPYNETFAGLSTSPRVVSVLCCRCTPQQKASIVRLLKSPVCGNLTTLAIGDGGNDVGMIQTADVGVGLEGNEGKHAARAADFALPQFRLLPRLILVHGRLSYYRTALIAQYTFYKSACIGLLQLFYNAWCGYSGCSLLDSFALTSYNMVFTFVPAIMMTVDVDVSLGLSLFSPSSSSSFSSSSSSASSSRAAGRFTGLFDSAREIFFSSFIGKSGNGNGTPPPKQQQEAAMALLHRPHLYSSKGDFLSFRGFALQWLARAVFQSLTLLAIFIVGVGGDDGSTIDQQSLSYAVFTSLVILQLVTVVFSMSSPTALNTLTSVAFAALYLSLLVVKDVASGSVSLASFFGSPAVLLASLLALTVSSLGWLIPLPPGVCSLSALADCAAGLKMLVLSISRRPGSSRESGSSGGNSSRNEENEPDNSSTVNGNTIGVSTRRGVTGNSNANDHLSETISKDNE